MKRRLVGGIKARLLNSWRLCLILVIPRLLNYVIALYLIIIGVLALLK